MKMNRINPASPKRIQSPPQLSLPAGKVIKAQVIKLDGKQVFLQWGSSLLKAQTKVPLRRGDQLRLLVESNNMGLIKLKILNEGEKLPSGTPVLQRLGISAQKNLEKIVRQLLKFNMPVNPDTIKEINRLINRYKLNDDMSELIVWLESVGIKVDSEKDIQALGILRRFFRSELSGEAEARSFKFINETEKMNLDGYNIWGWPIGENHIYLLTPETKGEAVKPETCIIFLRIESQALQELWFKIEVVSNHLNVEIICNSDKHKSILAQELPRLQEALKATGYQVKDFSVGVAEVHKLFDLLPDYGQEIINVNLEV